jgi:alpha-1,2-mannosyltransferase
MHRALLRLVSPPLALATALVFAFATPTWSVTANSLTSHALTQTAIAGAAWAAASGRWWWGGAAMAVGITGRVHLAVVAGALGLGVAIAQRRPRIAVAVGVPSAVGVAFVVATNTWRYGVPNLSGGYAAYAEENLTATGADAWLSYLVNWAGFLVSPDRGLLLWTPALLVLVVPAARALRAAPAWVVSLAVGGVLYSFVQLRINAFGGGDTFYGYRLALEMVTCLVPLAALAVLQVRTTVTRAALVVLCWLQFAMIAPGALTWGLFASQDDVWRLSSYVLALAWQPAVSVAGLAFAAVGATVTLIMLRSSPAHTTPDPVVPRTTSPPS